MHTGLVQLRGPIILSSRQGSTSSHSGGATAGARIPGTLDLLHVAYARLVREEEEPMETNNRPGFESAQEGLREAASIDLHVV